MKQDITYYIPAEGCSFFGSIITRVKNFFANYRRDRLKRQEAQKAQELNERFNIEERHGLLFITCEGVAVQELTADYNAAEIVDALNNARKSAAKFNSKNQTL